MRETAIEPARDLDQQGIALIKREHRRWRATTATINRRGVCKY
jgi:hypothetical protein